MARLTPTAVVQVLLQQLLFHNDAVEMEVQDTPDSDPASLVYWDR